MKKIPKIIHQIWSGVDEPLPEQFKILAETWKRDYPSWTYEFWDNERMNSFVQENYPQHWEVYSQYPYNVQRWDAIRYLILDKIGGMYVDLDYESICALDHLIEEKTCCFALEPQSHSFMFRKKVMFNNALMASVPNHPFMQKIIETVFSPKMLTYDISPTKVVIYDSSSNVIKEHLRSAKNNCVMNTTGPWVLINLYKKLSDEEKNDVYLIPAKYVSPFDGFQTEMILSGVKDDDLEKCLEDAFAVHYYVSNWRKNEK